ncbi:hypothetical protein BDR26DRAFT_848770 [Obelidium mucronatum]|nr:hypothetical protein BDR26DRAFT_848770 [Obelidium mucronatum]
MFSAAMKSMFQRRDKATISHQQSDSVSPAFLSRFPSLKRSGSCKDRQTQQSRDTDTLSSLKSPSILSCPKVPKTADVAFSNEFAVVPEEDAASNVSSFTSDTTLCQPQQESFLPQSQQQQVASEKRKSVRFAPSATYSAVSEFEKASNVEEDTQSLATRRKSLVSPQENAAKLSTQTIFAGLAATSNIINGQTQPSTTKKGILKKRDSSCETLSSLNENTAAAQQPDGSWVFVNARVSMVDLEDGLVLPLQFWVSRVNTPYTSVIQLIEFGIFQRFGYYRPLASVKASVVVGGSRRKSFAWVDLQDEVEWRVCVAESWGNGGVVELFVSVW